MVHEGRVERWPRVGGDASAHPVDRRIATPTDQDGHGSALQRLPAHARAADDRRTEGALAARLLELLKVCKSKVPELENNNAPGFGYGKGICTLSSRLNQCTVSPPDSSIASPCDWNDVRKLTRHSRRLATNVTDWQPGI